MSDKYAKRRTVPNTHGSTPEPEPETESAPPPRILKVRDPPSQKQKPLHPHLPQPPACVLMVSPVKTGKSTIISNLLLNEHFYGHEYFDDVFAGRFGGHIYY